MESSAAATEATSSCGRDGSRARGSPTRASRSPALIRRATRAVVCSRLVTRVTANAPTSSVAPIASADDHTMALSRPSMVRSPWVWSMRTASARPPAAGPAAHIVGRPS